MILLESILVAFTQLWANKVRSVLTLLGMLIGVGAVVGIISISEGLRRMVYDEFGKLGGANFAYIAPREWIEKEGGWVPAPRFDPFTLDDLPRVQAVSERIEAVLPLLGAGFDMRFRKASYDVQVEATTPAYAAAFDWDVAQGRFLRPADLEANRRVCVIGRKVADEVFGARPPVGEEVKLNGQRYLVIGVMADRRIFDQDWGDRVILPVTTAQKRLFGFKRIHALFLYFRDADDAPVVLPQVERELKRWHGRDAQYEVQSGRGILDEVEGVILVMKLVSGGIAGISLLVGGIGIMNIMLVSVTERTREIGIRKALGARPATLMGQFVVEAIVLSLCGGALGVGLGVGLGLGIARVIEHYAEIPFPSVVSLSSVLLSLGVSTAIGLFFGIYPAARAARLDPVDALSFE